MTESDSSLESSPRRRPAVATLRLESRNPSEVVRAFALYGLVFRTAGAGLALVFDIPWLILVQVLGALLYVWVLVRSSKMRSETFLWLLGPEWLLWAFSISIAVGVRPYFHIHTIVVTASILFLLHDLSSRLRIVLFILPAVVPVPTLMLLHATVPQIELSTAAGDFWIFVNQLLGGGFLLFVSGIAMLDHGRARRLAEERAEAQKLLIEDLSHELRTPIATILTASQGAQGHREIPEPVAEPLEWIEESARAGGRLVERMLDLAVLDRGWRREPEPERLGAAVHAAVDRLRPLAASQSVDLRLCAEVEPDRSVDTVSLEIVLQNLVSNALHHSPEGGKVEIRLCSRVGTTRIEVEDRGEGIAAEDLSRVFDRMWRGDRSRARDEGRFGLGLSIAEHHAALLGAVIEVRSEVGKGAVFSLVFR